MIRQPIYKFVWTTTDGKTSFGFVSGRTEKESRNRLKNRYKLTEIELLSAKQEGALVE